jgi:dTDP-4-dehydrorhamnose reductase
MVIGSLNLAKVRMTLDTSWCSIPPIYVFDGRKMKPYVETDAVFPQSVYAVTKYAGEQLVQNYCTKYFGYAYPVFNGKIPMSGQRRKFISTMVKLSKEKSQRCVVVQDEILTPTPTREIAKNTMALVETERYDVYPQYM